MESAAADRGRAVAGTDGVGAADAERLIGRQRIASQGRPDEPTGFGELHQHPATSQGAVGGAAFEGDTDITDSACLRLKRSEATEGADHQIAQGVVETQTRLGPARR
ncbi:hypothetical protein KBZ08_15310 [Cyanobium sp. Candia 9D4]|nr:hypothetical protein [Cyanobium sp. Candia 9D4]